MSSITETYFGYRGVCARAAIDQDFFKTFKSNAEYRKVLEHANKAQGYNHYEVIKQQTPMLLNSLDDFEKNDLIGSPKTEEYPFGIFSPSTLQYVKVLSDLLTFFGETALKDIRVLEIGIGYGGQFCILSNFLSFKNYTFVDLPEPIALAKQYLVTLKKFNESTIFIEHENDIVSVLAQNKYDLIISNYAFSEIYKEIQERYIELFKTIPMGYLTCNQLSNKCLSKSEMIKAFPFEVSVANDIEKENKNNYIIRWKQQI